MHSARSAGAIVIALALVGLCASSAAAQPTVRSQQNGNQVRLDWTAVPGATHYEMLVTGTLNVQGQVPTTFLVVTPPPGNYHVQVRAMAGTTAGAWSAPVSVTVGASAPAACGAPAAPTVNVSASGSSVTISWSAVAGSIGYRISAGSSPGASEFVRDVPASQTSFSAMVPSYGTFYIRVASAASCGALATSAEKSITIGASTPGATAPTPTSVPNLVSQVNACRARYPAEFACAHTGRSCTRQFIVLCARDMNRQDPNVGLNWKRGVVGSLSEDIIAYRGVGTAVDIVNGGRMEIIDVINGAGGPSPSIGWNVGPGGPGDRGGWVNPFSINP